MCPHQDCFATYELVDTGIILIGSDTKCKAAGVDIVQIKTHDVAVRTLSKVRHFPDMTHSLISLGTLKANGCRYSAENGVLKVMKRAMVLRKGFK